MKRFGNGAILMVFWLCAAVVLAGADEKKKLRRTTAVAVQAATPTGLPPTIKIDLKKMPRSQVYKEVKALTPAFYDAWKRVVQSYGYLVEQIPQYEEATRVYKAKCQECAGRSYSQADMAAAGCLPGDTLEQCSAKLFRWCIAPYDKALLSLSMFVNFGALSKYSKIVEDEFYNSILNKK